MNRLGTAALLTALVAAGACGKQAGQDVVRPASVAGKDAATSTTVAGDAGEAPARPKGPRDAGPHRGPLDASVRVAPIPEDAAACPNETRAAMFAQHPSAVGFYGALSVYDIVPAGSHVYYSASLTTYFPGSLQGPSPDENGLFRASGGGATAEEILAAPVQAFAVVSSYAFYCADAGTLTRFDLTTRATVDTGQACPPAEQSVLASSGNGLYWVASQAGSDVLLHATVAADGTLSTPDGVYTARRNSIGELFVNETGAAWMQNGDVVFLASGASAPASFSHLDTTDYYRAIALTPTRIVVLTVVQGPYRDGGDMTIYPGPITDASIVSRDRVTGRVMTIVDNLDDLAYLAATDEVALWSDRGGSQGLPCTKLLAARTGGAPTTIASGGYAPETGPFATDGTAFYWFAQGGLMRWAPGEL